MQQPAYEPAKAEGNSAEPPQKSVETEQAREEGNQISERADEAAAPAEEPLQTENAPRDAASNEQD